MMGNENRMLAMMSTEIITSLITAGVAVISLLVSILVQFRITRLQHQLLQQRETQSQEAKANEILAKYRDPLLKSAHDLQSRFYNLLMGVFLGPIFRMALQTRKLMHFKIQFMLLQSIWVG
jgi:hypothetical protein